MQAIIFGVIGLLIGGVLVYSLLVTKLQRQLASAERKLERANRAIEETESQRSQQANQSQELQNARQQIQALEASYQAQISNLEQSYERQLQELEEAQGSVNAPVGISPDQVRHIEQSYQAQIQELQAAHRNEKEAIEQSYQSQIKDLQETHQQELENIKQQIQPVQSFDPSAPTEEKSGGWGGTAMGAAAIAGAAGLAGWATSNFLHQDEEKESPETAEVTESPAENWADEPMGQAVLQEAELAGWITPQPEAAEESVVENENWQETESPFAVSEENWADEPMGQAVLQEAELAGWITPQPEITEEITEEFVTEEPIAESPFETPDFETPEDNWVDSPFGEVAESAEEVAEEAAIAETETDLSAWSEVPESFETPEFQAPEFETPEAFETPEFQAPEFETPAAFTEEADLGSWTETEQLEGFVDELTTEGSEQAVIESPFGIPEETPEDNWVDSPFGPVEESAEQVAEEAAIAETETDLSAWTETPETFETPEFELPEFETPEAFTEEIVTEGAIAEGVEEPDISSLFDLAAETPETGLEENWVDAPTGDLDLANWGETEQTPNIEESVLSFEENISTPESWNLGETSPSTEDVELPSLDGIENIENLSTSDDLNFLSMLQSEEEPAIAEPDAFSAFPETAEPALPDFLGEETLETDLQLLDLLPTQEPDFAETLAGESPDPFINFFDSETEKSDLEFLEMLKTEDDDTVNRSSLDESDDLFGDLFKPEESPSPDTDMNDLFNASDNHFPEKKEGGLEELFSDEALSFEDWDLPGSPKSPSS